MPQVHPTKTIARRIEPDYHRRLSPMRKLRRFLTAAAVLITAGWLAWAHHRNGQRLYLPGPVIASHAMFENNCTACHDGGGGRFSKAVSDRACLSCHDAAIHAPAQIALVSLRQNGKPERSSQCTTCHVEHKGHGVMLASDDRHCLHCHQDLPASTRGGKTQVAGSVAGFGLPPQHPSFGRTLRSAATQPWRDPTPLKYNHKLHIEQRSHLQDCRLCHSAGQGLERRIISPIRYEVHCQGCHPLEIGTSSDASSILLSFTHGPMSGIRSEIQAIGPRMLEALANHPNRAAKQVTIVARPRPRPTAATAEQWLAEQLKQTQSKISKWSAAEEGKIPPLPAPATRPAEGGVNPRLMEWYLAFGAPVACAKCHEMRVSGSEAQARIETVPTTWKAPAPSPIPATPQPATPAPTATAATSPATRPANDIVSITAGVPRATTDGRQWFTGAVFDHEAHRMMACVDCHGAATTSTLTSDVLLPDIQTCAACHHTGGAKAAAASSRCTSCHGYHEPSAPRAPAVKRTIAQLTGK